MPHSRVLRRLLVLLIAPAAIVPTLLWARRELSAQARPAAAARPFTVEYYYKVRWGHFAEFKELYQRNHYPLLKRYQQMGRIVSMSAAYPVYHAGEGARWDMRFTIVWKDAATAHDDFDQTPTIRELYPDQAKFRAEEQRRFELLVEHIDVPVVIDDWSGWPR